MTELAARVSAPVPRRRGPASTEDGQCSRDRILKAALDLITEAGIGRVRLAEIARRANMSSGQVMYYFTSKERLRQMHQLSRKRLIELVMKAARTELAPGSHTGASR